MDLLNIVLFSALLATGFAEVADSSACRGVGSEAICSVSEVRITPCKNPAKCLLKKGSNAELSFDFKPNFVASKLSTLVYWDNGKAELPFLGFGSNDACTYTTCPTEIGKQQTLNYSMHIGRKLPQGVFSLKWKVWNEDNKEEVCCFTTTVWLKK